MPRVNRLGRRGAGQGAPDKHSWAIRIPSRSMEATASCQWKAPVHLWLNSCSPHDAGDVVPIALCVLTETSPAQWKLSVARAAPTHGNAEPPLLPRSQCGWCWCKAAISPEQICPLNTALVLFKARGAWKRTVGSGHPVCYLCSSYSMYACMEAYVFNYLIYLSA